MSTAEQEVSGTGVAVVPGRMVGLLKPIAPVADIIAAQEQQRQFIMRALTKGRDYGVIPGTDRGESGGKNVLYKAGAERTCAGYGVRPQFTVVESEVDHSREVTWRKRKKQWGQRRGEFTWVEENGLSHGLYRYVVSCTLVHVESSLPVGEGVGSCSTMEGKYVDRPRESENTVLKMAKKRAFVDATLTTFGLSDAFTQDVEDGFEEVESEVVSSDPIATPEQVRAFRAAIVEIGATRPYLKWFDGQTQEPRTVGWFEAATADVRKKVEAKKASETAAVVGELVEREYDRLVETPLPDVFEARPGVALPEVADPLPYEEDGDSDRLPF